MTPRPAQLAPGSNHYRDGRGVLWKMSDFCGSYVRVICGTWQLPAQTNAIKEPYYKALSPQH